MAWIDFGVHLNVGSHSGGSIFNHILGGMSAAFLRSNLFNLFEGFPVVVLMTLLSFQSASYSRLIHRCHSTHKPCRDDS